jgi:peroxin-19
VPATAAAPDDADDADDDADFVRALQAGMADLLGELETSPEMAKQFEDMMRELGGAGIPGLTGLGGLGGAAAAAVAADAAKKEGGAQAGGEAKAAAPPETKAKAAGAADGAAAPKAEEPAADFQESIRRTMERMRESGEAAGAVAAGAAGGAAGGAGGDGEADLMAALLREMGEGGAGDGSEEDFSKMLLGMMEQLTNKDILYEPMKELHDKFPGWMTENRDKVPEADLKRYEEQQRLVKEIVGKFEEAGYSDDNVESRQFIVDRMQQVRSAGFEIPTDDLDASRGITTGGAGWGHGRGAGSNGRHGGRVPDAVMQRLIRVRR